MALLAFLPIVGIGAVLIPTSLYLFLTGRISAGVFFIVFYIILSGGVEYVLKPKLVGDRVQHAHPAGVFFHHRRIEPFRDPRHNLRPLIVTAFLTLTDIYQSAISSRWDYRSRMNPIDFKPNS